MCTSEVGVTRIAFAGSTAAKELDGSNTIWSDSIETGFAKNIAVYPTYTAGAATSGNKLNLRIQMSPLDDKQDPTNVAWHNYVTYINTSGTWNEQDALFATIAGTAGTPLLSGPIVIDLINAKRIRVGVEEAGTGNKGSFTGYVAKNTVN